MAERIAPGSMAGVTVLDRAGKVFERCVMPSVPTYAAAIAGAKVGPPHVGTCAAAVYRGATVTSSDVSGDMRFDPAWRSINIEHGIKRIQSRPAVSADGRALGSFFIGFTSLEPAPWPDEVAAVGARLAGLAIDRHLASERDRLLIGETQHRLKNLFSSVLSIAAQTQRSHESSAEFLKAFEGRVQTLAAAHDLLSQDDPVDLGLLVRRIVGPFAPANAVEVAGPSFKLATASIVPCSLVFHELATYAAKYGALSCPQGRARISWKAYRAENGEPRFKFKWQETGGPMVAPPQRRGFGTLLVMRAFADIEGLSRLTHAPEGVGYKVDAPLNERVGSAQASAS